jgi:hypothetical protein
VSKFSSAGDLVCPVSRRAGRATISVLSPIVCKHLSALVALQGHFQFFLRPDEVLAPVTGGVVLPRVGGARKVGDISATGEFVSSLPKVGADLPEVKPALGKDVISSCKDAAFLYEAGVTLPEFVAPLPEEDASLGKAKAALP